MQALPCRTPRTGNNLAVEDGMLFAPLILRPLSPSTFARANRARTSRRGQTSATAPQGTALHERDRAGYAGARATMLRPAEVPTLNPTTNTELAAVHLLTHCELKDGCFCERTRRWQSFCHLSCRTNYRNAQTGSVVVYCILLIFHSPERSRLSPFLPCHMKDRPCRACGPVRHRVRPRHHHAAPDQ